MDNRTYRNSSLVGGLLLIVLGLIFFFVTQGTFGLDWSNFWPLIPMIAGVGMLVMAFVADNPKERAGWVIWGTIALLVGAFFMITTTGILSWEDQGTLWPVYPLIVGVAFLAAYVTTGLSQPGFLVPGVILTLVGLVFLGIVFTGSSYDYAGKIWPIFLIIAGILILVLPRARHAT
jgi:hypothetical protein